MTPALARVAKSVLAQPGVVLSQSITELAEYAKSFGGQRHASAIGYSGFQDFKLALARELAVRENLAEAPRSTDAVERLVETAVTALKETERLIDRADLEKAANTFLQARCMRFSVWPPGLSPRNISPINSHGLGSSAGLAKMRIWR